MYKTYKTILYERLYIWCQNNSIVLEEQHGFTKEKSTKGAVRQLNSIIETDIYEHKRCYTVFVDFKKAFDTLNRSVLQKKLVKIGVSTGFVTIWYDILKYNVLRVAAEGYLSEPITQRIGLLRGDKLSPLLFTIFIAWYSQKLLPGILKSCGCTCIFYADDLVITSGELYKVKIALHKLGLYCQETSVQVNVQKTEAMKFRNGGRLRNIDRLRYLAEKK